MNKIDFFILVTFLIFILVNVHKAYKNNWYKEKLKRLFERNKKLSPVEERRLFYRTYYLKEVKYHKKKIRKKAFKKWLSRIPSIFYFENKNSRLVFLAIVSLMMVSYVKISSWFNLIVLIISITILIYIAYDKLLENIKKNHTNGIHWLFYFPMVGIIYNLGFTRLIGTSDKTIIPMLIFSIYSILITLVFAISISNIAIKSKILKFSYSVFWFISSLFLAYFSLGYALVISKYGINNNDIFINTKYDTISTMFSFFISYGQSTITRVPEIVFASKKLAGNIEVVKTTTLQIHLIGIAFTTIFTSINLGYLSRIIFQENNEEYKKNLRERGSQFNKRWR